MYPVPMIESSPEYISYGQLLPVVSAGVTHATAAEVAENPHYHTDALAILEHENPILLRKISEFISSASAGDTEKNLQLKYVFYLTYGMLRSQSEADTLNRTLTRDD